MSHPSARRGVFAPLRRTLTAAFSLAATAALLNAVPAQAASPSPDLDVYVSPTGRDSGSGTAAHPFKTLDHARDHVRDVKQKAKGDIHVRLMSGTYQLSRTFALTSRDSGRDGHRIVYEAAPGAHPVISGGRQVTGWTPADSSGKVYKAKVGAIDTRQLYVNGESETRARSDKNPAGFSQTSTGYTFTDPALNAYKRPSDLEVVSSWGWKLMRCPVQSIADFKMTMQQPCWHNAHLQQGQEIQNPTWLENARELLDTPGEWYLDKGAGELYYMPKAGQNLSTANVTVPLVQDLVDLNGTRSAPVSNVSFRGITFANSTWLAPSSSEGLIEGQAGFRMVGNDPTFDATRLKWQKTRGAVNVDHGHGIGFEGNTFTQLGAVGLNLDTGTQGTDITGNVFRQIAATGIQIGGVEVIDAHPDDSRDITKNTTVANNVVTKVADQYNGSVGILAGYTDRTTITHNKVYDLPYTGISVGWGWGLTDKGGDTNYPGNLGVPIWDTPTTSRDTRVTDNEIYDIMKSQADGGAIYTLSSNPGGVVSGNYIHGTPRPPTARSTTTRAAGTGRTPATPCATSPTNGCSSTTAWTSTPRATSRPSPPIRPRPTARAAPSPATPRWVPATSSRPPSSTTRACKRVTATSTRTPSSPTTGHPAGPAPRARSRTSRRSRTSPGPRPPTTPPSPATPSTATASWSAPRAPPRCASRA